MHLLTQSALLRALGWTLFSSLWQMSLLWACYHFFVLIFRHAPSRARHNMALLLLTTGTVWSAITFVTNWFGPDSYRAAIPDPSQDAPALLLRTGHWLTGAVNEALPWCSSLYLLILGVLLARYFRHYLLSRRIVRVGLSKISPEFRVFVERTARHMGIQPAVRVHLSNLVDVPVTLGFLKPVILLPVAILTQLTTQQVEAILIHELSHVRRKDYLLNLLITAVELVYFFNPFARMLTGHLKKEREHCCDDQVLEFRYDPHAYVSALLSLARQHRQGHLALAAIGGGGDRLLLQRARKILQQKSPVNRPRPFLLLFFGLVMAIAALGPSRHGNEARFPKQPVTALQPFAGTYVTDLREFTILLPNTTVSEPVAQGSATELSRVITHDSRHRPRRSRNSPLIRPMGHPSDQDPEEDEYAASFINTAGSVSAAAPVYADLVEPDNRDYSIGKTDGGKPSPQPKKDEQRESFPFVPNSSFSFQFTDTLPPAAKMALMEQANEKEFRMQIAKLQTQLKAQLDILREQENAIKIAAKEQARAGLINTEERQLKEMLEQQMRFQQQYLKNLEIIQRQLKAKHRVTVYI